MADDNQGGPTSRTVVAAAATGVTGFGFGVFAQLGMAGLLAQQSAFALTVFCAAAALILAAGRATLDIAGSKHWAIDGLIGLFAIVTAVGVYLVFFGPTEVNTFATFGSSLSDNTDSPKLVPLVDLGNGIHRPLNDVDIPIRVSAQRGITIRVQNLESLLAQYAADEANRRTEAQRLSTLLQSQTSAEK